ncbi:MAG: FMN-binding protein [Desulfosporosinus sp.]
MTQEHTHNNNGILKIALNLICACIISGLIIAVVYTLTASTALAKQAELKTLSLKSLVTEADTYQEIPGKDEWFAAIKDGQTIAYIVPAESKGYSGAIELLVAISPDHKVMKYTILESSETPGLGDKAKEEPFAGQFVGKGVEQLEVTKDPSKKELIQSISGSTITSRAVTKAVSEAVEEVTVFVQGGK